MDSVEYPSVGHRRMGKDLPTALCARRPSACLYAIPPILDWGVCPLKELIADWKLLLVMSGAAIAAPAMIAYAFFRPALDPHEAQRTPRIHLNPICRLPD